MTSGARSENTRRAKREYWRRRHGILEAVVGWQRTYSSEASIPPSERSENTSAADKEPRGCRPTAEDPSRDDREPKVLARKGSKERIHTTGFADQPLSVSAIDAEAPIHLNRQTSFGRQERRWNAIAVRACALMARKVPSDRRLVLTPFSDRSLHSRTRAASRRWCRASIPQRYVPPVYRTSNSTPTYPCSAGIPVFGPSPEAALLEGSKTLSKDFMQRHNIPTAGFRSFTAAQYDDARAYLESCGFARVVLKASGLAAGKGVLLPETIDEAKQALKSVLVDKEFGSAGDEIVIEEYLEGPELSILAFSDGYTIKPLPAAQDHKRIGEGDVGLNTGGMGAYAPAPVCTDEVMATCVRECLEPTIRGMRKDGKACVDSPRLLLIPS